MKNFFARFFRKREDLVPYHDFTTGKAILIPRAELGPGTVLVQIEGQPHPVYADSAQLQAGAHRHPPFEGELKVCIESLVVDLNEVRALSYEEWEDGFRRDQNPEQEIAGWLHLAAILKVMTRKFALDPAQRKECYRVLVACYTGERATVRERSDPKLLSQEQIDLAVRYFFEGGYKGH
jgi:hypothetical protein